MPDQRRTNAVPDPPCAGPTLCLGTAVRTSHCELGEGVDDNHTKHGQHGDDYARQPAHTPVGEAQPRSRQAHRSTGYADEKQGQAAKPHKGSRDDRAGYRGEDGSTGRPTMARADRRRYTHTVRMISHASVHPANRPRLPPRGRAGAR